MYPVPLAVYLELTEKCNLRCRHCYCRDSLGRGDQDLSDDDMAWVAKKILEEGVFEIVLTGGEPLLRFELVKRILEENNQFAHLIGINTNLLLFKESMIPTLRKSRGLLISCPAVEPGRYSWMTQGGNYDRWKSAFQTIVTSQIGYEVNMVVCAQNLNDIRRVAQEMEALGCSWFSVTPMLYCSRNEEIRGDILSKAQLNQFFDEFLWVANNTKLGVNIRAALPKCSMPTNILEGDWQFLVRSCQAGRRSVAISSRGEVRPCPNQPKSYGNITRESLQEIYARMEEWRSGAKLPAECKTCKALSRCYGACRAQAENCFGDPHAKDIWANEAFVRSPFSPSLQEPSKTVVYSLSDKVRVNDSFSWREEGDMYRIYNAQDSVSLRVNDIYMKFILDLRNSLRAPCSLQSLAQSLDLDSDSIMFDRIVRELLTMRVLVNTSQNAS